MIRSQVIGIGAHLPPTIVTNEDLVKLMDTSDEWIFQRSGIKTRHWVGANEEIGTSDIALEAAQKALVAAGISKDELDMIVLATLSPDHEFPGTACFLQAKLGVPGIPALDVRQQCSGFLYGLSIADQFIRNGVHKTVLVVGAEVQTKGLDKTTRGREVTVLFADGAGAIILRGQDVPDGTQAPRGVISTHLHADGTYAKELWVKAPSFAAPSERMTAGMVERGEQYPYMNGKAVFVHACKRMVEVLLEVLKANNTKIEEVDLFFFHQANLRINEMVSKQLGIPAEKVFNTIEKYGNTTAATIPLGMEDAVRIGRLKPGMLVAGVAFGSGFTWGATLIRW